MPDADYVDNAGRIGLTHSKSNLWVFTRYQKPHNSVISHDRPQARNTPRAPLDPILNSWHAITIRNPNKPPQDLESTAFKCSSVYKHTEGG